MVVPVSKAMSFITPRSPVRRLALPAAGMALVMACSSTLPAVAAATHTASPIPQELLLAKDNDKDDKKKKKKNNKKKTNKQHQETRNKDRNNKDGNNKGRNNKDRNKFSDQNKNQRELNQKQRERIYRQGVKDGKEKGFEKGKEKGYDKGVRSGYRDGLDKGRERGYDRGYNKGYDRGYRRASDRWKGWDSNRWRDYNRRDRNIWSRRTTVVNNYYGNPGWARNRGWYNNRPWGGGWYGGWGSSSPPWGWWFGQSLVWGITTLTTAAIINNAIDRAIERRQPTVIVPNTNWQLYYGSVQPIQDYGATFAVYNGAGTYQMEADCNEGLLNGDVPRTPAEAQLLNAACQVTFGAGQI